MSTNISGIYGILCRGNNKIYIGSSNNVKRRWNEHRIELSNNRCKLPKLQNSYNKYKQYGFNFFLLEKCTEDNLLVREQYYMDLFDSTSKSGGLNSAKFADRRTKGWKHSSTAKAKMKQSAIIREANKIGIYRNCKVCNKEIYVNPTDEKLNRGFYCSRDCWNNRTLKSIEEYISEKSTKSLDNDCILWRGLIKTPNTPILMLGKHRAKTYINVRKYIYENEHGLVNNNLSVSITCNNAKCIKPEHLKTFTRSELVHNSRIMGTINNGSKFSIEQVKSIRNLYDTKQLTVKQIAERYNVTINCIYYIVRRVYYKHI